MFKRKKEMQPYKYYKKLKKSFHNLGVIDFDVLAKELCSQIEEAESIGQKGLANLLKSKALTIGKEKILISKGIKYYCFADQEITKYIENVIVGI